MRELNENAMDMEGKPVVVVGLARSGIAAAAFLAGRGLAVVATDRRPALELEAEALRIEALGVGLELGGHREATFTGASLVVVSPGVPWDLPEIQAARRAGVPVIAEIELGFRNLSGPVAAVTGTKGKSTTTAALGAMLREAGRDVRVGGNIGHALTGLLEGSTDQTVFVLETSSFQLEGTETFRPRVAVFTNLSADHLDRHPSFEDYARAKSRIFRNQTPEDWAVVNADDEGVLALARAGRARLLPFRVSGPPLGEGAYFEDGNAWLRTAGQRVPLFPVALVQVPGVHLRGDLLAAAAAAHLLGAGSETISRAVAGFRGVEHTLERVDEVGGVVFFNDSKATNVAAAQKSLEAFPGPVLPIIGGRYKGGDFRDLGKAVIGHARVVFAIGEARPRLTQALSDLVPVVECESLGAAVEQAFAAARPGDTVVLAPACSSFDMFRDYADRGRAFKAEVARLRRTRAGHG
jgi:UDP-N-acetylmuramoylalanine--D-glutamate ligase